MGGLGTVLFFEGFITTLASKPEYSLWLDAPIQLTLNVIVQLAEYVVFVLSLANFVVMLFIFFRAVVRGKMKQKRELKENSSKHISH